MATTEPLQVEWITPNTNSVKCLKHLAISVIQVVHFCHTPFYVNARNQVPEAEKNRAAEQETLRRSKPPNHGRRFGWVTKLSSPSTPRVTKLSSLSFPKQNSTENIVKKSGQMSGLEGDQMAA